MVWLQATINRSSFSTRIRIFLQFPINHVFWKGRKWQESHLFGCLAPKYQFSECVSLLKNVVSLNHDEIYFIWEVAFENGQQIALGGKSQGKVSQDNDLVDMGTYSTVFASLEQNVSLHSCFETGYLLFSLYILLGLDLSAHSELLYAFTFTFLKIIHLHAFIGCLLW